MTKITTITALPPPIIQHFNATLLSQRTKMVQASSLRERYTPEMNRRYRIGGRKHREFDELLEIYGQINEWQKAKEAYDKAEDKKVAQKPDIPVAALYKLRGSLGRVVRRAFRLSA